MTCITEKRPANANAVAIVLLTKNGATFLEECLQAIYRQESRYPFEILAVDSGSTDATRAILKKYAVRVTEIPPSDFNHGGTRNLAASLASPDVEYLVYLSQDTTPLPGWLDALVDTVAGDAQVAGAFSRHVPRPDCNPLLARRILEEWEQVGGQRRVVKCLDGAPDLSRDGHALAHFSNTSSCLRRDVWRTVPFPEVDFAEDLAWAVRVLESGYCLVYEPASAVLHSHSGSLSRLFKENIDSGRGVRAALRDWTNRLMPARNSVPQRIYQDLRFLSQCQKPLHERIGWMLYTPLWYTASTSGQWIGAHIERGPLWLRERLSWQAMIKQET
jgi:rhamnosyltransferase